MNPFIPYPVIDYNSCQNVKYNQDSDVKVFSKDSSGQCTVNSRCPLLECKSVDGNFKLYSTNSYGCYLNDSTCSDTYNPSYQPNINPFGTPLSTTTTQYNPYNNTTYNPYNNTTYNPYNPYAYNPLNPYATNPVSSVPGRSYFYPTNYPYGTTTTTGFGINQCGVNDLTTCVKDSSNKYPSGCFQVQRGNAVVLDPFTNPSCFVGDPTSLNSDPCGLLNRSVESIPFQCVQTCCPGNKTAINYSSYPFL